VALVDLTLGRYTESRSFVHRLDSRTKLLVVILLTIASLYARKPVSFLLLYAFLAAGIILSRVPVRYALRNLKFFVWLIALAVILNLFFTSGTVALRIGFLSVTREGIALSLISMARLVFVIVAASLLSLTTSPLDLTDGMSRALGFLKKLKVPVSELGLMSSLALSYVPVLVDEVGQISLVQRSRGAVLQGKNLRAFKGSISLIVPVLLSTFRKADKLAMAMEARCFTTASRRTSMLQSRIRRADYLVIACSVIVASASVLFAR
jgi:energy-coupling factor transport system permease protein